MSNAPRFELYQSTTTETSANGATKTKTCTIATPFKDVARVQCMCGKSAVRFLCGNKRPANNCAHLECGCCDCRAAVQWAHSMGGPEPPMIMDGTYWPNDLEVIRGKENLRGFLLREGMHSTRLVATCCHTTLMVDHPFYEGKVCLVFRDAQDLEKNCVLKNAIIDCPAQMRVFNRDLPADLAAIPCRDGGTVFTGDEPDFLEQVTVKFDAFKEFTLTTQGQTVQSLFEEVGVTTLGYSSEPTAQGGAWQEDIMNRVIIPMTMAAEAEAATN